MHSETKSDWLVAFVLFAVVLVAYVQAMALSTPFWDAGEFIATSYILGIPHPPGTPLYVLIGRVFCLFPISSVAARVNFMSALASVLAVMFTFLVTVKLTKMSFKMQGWKAWVPGIVASLFMAFSNTFWNNGNGAEVYSTSSFVMLLTFWMALRWMEAFDQNHSDKVLLGIVYILSLAIGIHLGTLLVAPGILVLVLLTNWRSAVRPKLLTLSALLFVLGVSVHLYLLIRANLNPDINEAAPKTWHDLWLVLKRDQYKPGSIFVRRATFSFQFGMFWNYFVDQYTMWGGKLRVVGSYLPFLLALVGAYYHAVFNRKTFAAVLTVFLICSLGLIIYLNFTDHEVRERDYFYAAAFHFFTIWMGLGAAGLIHKSLKATKHLVKWQLPVAAGVSCVLLVGAALPYFHFHYTHDIHKDRVARNFGYNMLAPLDKNAVLLTNGDNDTFPLWYIQEVEGFRKDVRVANLSLMRTNWYIKQLKNYPPKIPLTLSDSEIDRLAPFRDKDGKVWQTNEYVVYDMIGANNWRRPLYIAVTVPDQMGLERRLVLEGLVFRISAEAVGMRIDEEKMRKSMYEIYDWTGVLTPQGTTDNSYYKDLNCTRLIQNYAATAFTFAYWYRQNNRMDKAIELMERARTISPTFPDAERALGEFYLEAGRLDKAEPYYVGLLAKYPADPEVRFQLGRIYAATNRLDLAVDNLKRSIELDRTFRYPYIALADVYAKQGKMAERDAVLRAWLEIQPDDAAVREYLEKGGAK
jgi:Protein O-mannosyl-transferase TMEM260-like/Tetratricopeptide repeat